MNHPFGLVLGAVALTALALVLVPIAVTAATQAQQSPDIQSTWRANPPNESPPSPSVPPPKPLARTQLSAAFGAALKRVDPSKSMPVPVALPTRLTPNNQRLPDGTRLQWTYGIAFDESGTDAPNGVIWLLGDGGYHESKIRMRLSTEKDRYYVADCQVREVDPYPYYSVDHTVEVTAPGLVQTFPVTDGHVIFAFRAESVGSTITLGYKEHKDHEDVYHMMGWYGCDFGKAG